MSAKKREPTMHRVGDNVCPNCSLRLSGATNMTRSRAPVKGDVTVCLGCGTLLVFVDDKQLRLLTNEEFVELPAKFREQLAKMRSNTKHAYQKIMEIPGAAIVARDPEQTMKPEIPWYFDRQGRAIKLDEMGRLFGDRSYRFVKRSELRTFDAIERENPGDPEPLPPDVEAELRVIVITIWTGFDSHMGMAERPVIFETTAFSRQQANSTVVVGRMSQGGLKLTPNVLWEPYDRIDPDEYATEEDAIAGHDRMVQLVLRIQADEHKRSS